MNNESEDVLSGWPAVGLEGFVPDPALNLLYRQAVITAKQYGWLVPERVEFERRYKEEIQAARRENQQNGETDG
ncbi:MAG TPA: hypothetical protein VGR55_00530 [Candidatus Acidoferrum sp.]|nr:hypothetical protein [Candidatus Acidoferrum sp.]